MPPPKIDETDVVIFSVGDDWFGLTASVEQIDPPDDESVMAIGDRAKKKKLYLAGNKRGQSDSIG